jgi:hypothetical protein
MSKEQALHLLVAEAFNSKRKRMENGIELPYPIVQLCSYFTGYTEIYDFRERLKRRKMANLT